MTNNKSVKLNIFSENIYADWQLEERKYINVAKRILRYYMSRSEVYEASCLMGEDFDTISFDFLYCDSVKTHEINREYRDKDYAADIITFAMFADSEPRFVFDGEINLGEVIIALDKVMLEAEKKGKTREEELEFLISHGILHLLGFDHQTQEDYNFVVKLQEEALMAIK